MTATIPTSNRAPEDESASDTAAAAATVVSIFALLIAVVSAGEVGRLSPSVAGLLIIAAAVATAIAFRSLFNRAHVLASAAALVLSLMGSGRSATFVLPLLVVVGALHLASIEQRYPRTIPALRTTVAAAAALLLGLLLEGLTFGPFSNPDSQGGGAEGQDRVEPAASEPVTEPNAVQRFVERITEFFRREDEGQPSDTAGNQGSGSAPPPEPDGGLDWIKLLVVMLILTVILILLGLVVRWWRRRPVSSVGGAAPPASALRRFEHIGEVAARGRRGSEGPITYGTAVDEMTGDQRLSDAGSIVSDYVYRPDGTGSPAVDPATLDRVLADLETRPPRPLEQPPPRRHRLRTLITRLVNR